MAGHSKWKQIKRQKGVADQRRGALFTKLAREITIAAKQGGADPAGNFRLRLAIQNARDNNMPADNIQRALSRASGSGEGGDLQEVTYEGYGPGGVAILIETMTDNRNRTVGEIRSVLTRAGGNLGETGSVTWQFESRGVIGVGVSEKTAEEIADVAIEAGAEDFQMDDESVEVHTTPTDLETVRQGLLDAGVEVANAELAMIAKTPIALDTKAAEQVIRLLEKIEDLDDVQRVYSNAEFSDEVLAAVGG
ncbi:MAG: YebC/PmpR family DNA-binding transcriptional regulator [Dehalococcoidia bacterium]